MKRIPVTKKVIAAESGDSWREARSTSANIRPNPTTVLLRILFSSILIKKVSEKRRGMKKLKIWTVLASGQEFGGVTSVRT